MSDEIDKNVGGEEGIDLSTFVPEDFKSEDGAYDTAAFRAKFDEFTAAEAQRSELAAGLPKDPSEYVFGLPEEHAFPEGFDPAKMATTDADGNTVEFDPAKMIDADDPDVKTLQGLMHGIAQGEVNPMDAMKRMAGLMVNRELTSIQKSMEAAQTERAALGADGGQARIDTVTRVLNAKLPAEQSKALLDSITSADGLRAVEALIKKSGAIVSPDTNLKPSMDGMSNLDLIAAGLKET